MTRNDAPFGLREMFIARTHHRRILLDVADRATGSRIGGAPPANVVAERVICPRCGGLLEYVLTLAEDTLSPAIARGRAVSLLCCRNWDCLCDSSALIEPSALVLLTHDDHPRMSDATSMDSAADGLGLTLGPLTYEEIDEDVGRIFIDHAKIGGGPGYIQHWGPAEEEKALSSGRGFLFQYHSPVFPRGHRSGADPFNDGVVYVFSRIDQETGLPTLVEFAAFWQCT